MIKKILIAMLCVAPAHAIEEAVTAGNLKTEPVEVSSTMSSTERRVRESAVKVVTLAGHGSGGLIRYKDFQLVITAQHVADGDLGTTYGVQTESERHTGVLIYADALHDIAVLFIVDHFVHTKGVKWKPSQELAKVATEITYSGFPSWHSLMTYRGRVAGYELDQSAGTQLMLNTYGWFGCSGALIYNVEGNAVGVLWGVDLQRGLPQENMIWVSPIQNLNLKLALRPLCEGMNNKPKACQ